MIGDINQSIAAIASPPGCGQRGVIRCSGQDLLSQLAQCFTSANHLSLASCRRAVVIPGWLDPGQPVGPLPVDLFVWPNHRSYTRQPSAEIHGPAAPPLLQEILRVLAACGIRQAAPGEFTLRAFLAGRIDLTRAEAVLGLIDSRSQAEMTVALQQLAGGLAGPVDTLRESLLEVTAHIEAGLDFVEDDIEFIAPERIVQSLDQAREQLQALIRQLHSRSVEDARIRVAICGRPNVGKSSLLNAFCRRMGQSARALVSDVPGTTRDYTTQAIQLEGIPFQLFDTAGNLDQWQFENTGTLLSHAEVDKQSGTMAGRIRDQAHLIILCVDASRPQDEWEAAQLTQAAGNDQMIVVGTKSDLLQGRSPGPDQPDLGVSSLTGEGLDRLCSRLVQWASGHATAAGLVPGTADRCREGLTRAAAELDSALQAARNREGDEVVAATLRLVLDELAIVTGRVYTDDILERVFSRFCIGK